MARKRATKPVVGPKAVAAAFRSVVGPTAQEALAQEQRRKKTHIIVRMTEDDERFNLKKGDVLEVHTYWLDPGSKFTVVRRLSDDYDPGCNVYRSQVEVLKIG